MAATVMVDKMRKLVGECSCLKYEMEIIMARFPKMVRMKTTLMNKYITPHVPADLKFSGQDLFPNSEQSVKSFEIFGERIINPLLDFSFGSAVPSADLIITSFQNIPNSNMRIQGKVSQEHELHN